MKATLSVTLFLVCILCTGCTLCQNLVRTTVIQPLQYCSHLDEHLERRRFRELAQLELERERCAARAETDDYTRPPFSIDHEQGFEDGFVDYLMYGGPGNPPPLPPRRYWWSNCENLAGCNAIQEWFQGFEHGVAAAKASGCRQCVTVPLSDSLIRDTLPVYGHWIETIDSETVVGPADGAESADPQDLPENTGELTAPSGDFEWINPGELGPAIQNPVSPIPTDQSSAGQSTHPASSDSWNELDATDLSNKEAPVTSTLDFQAAFAIEDSGISVEQSGHEQLRPDRRTTDTRLDRAYGWPTAEWSAAVSQVGMQTEQVPVPGEGTPAPKRITAPQRMTSPITDQATAGDDAPSWLHSVATPPLERTK